LGGRRVLHHKDFTDESRDVINAVEALYLGTRPHTPAYTIRTSRMNHVV
jgi:hypothetical protein